MRAEKLAVVGTWSQILFWRSGKRAANLAEYGFGTDAGEVKRCIGVHSLPFTVKKALWSSAFYRIDLFSSWFFHSSICFLAFMKRASTWNFKWYLASWKWLDWSCLASNSWILRFYILNSCFHGARKWSVTGWGFVCLFAFSNLF